MTRSLTRLYTLYRQAEYLFNLSGEKDFIYFQDFTLSKYRESPQRGGGGPGGGGKRGKMEECPIVKSHIIVIQIITAIIIGFIVSNIDLYIVLFCKTHVKYLNIISLKI
jgi:hypothetical protein